MNTNTVDSTTHVGAPAEADPAAQLAGALHLPGDPAYDQAVAPWNVAVPVSPAAVVVAASADDVAAAVRYAGEQGLRVAVQCTGTAQQRASTRRCCWCRRQRWTRWT
jgi:FAD/FMN-containing dehydrogenase